MSVENIVVFHANHTFLEPDASGHTSRHICRSPRFAARRRTIPAAEMSIEIVAFRRRGNSSGDSRASEIFRNARFSDNDLGTRLVSVCLRQSASLGVAFYLEEKPLVRVTRRSRLLELWKPRASDTAYHHK